MALVSFPDYLDSEGLTLGLPAERLESIRERSEAGMGLGELLEDPGQASGGLNPEHLLRLRRAVLRYADLMRAAADLEAPARLPGLLEIRAWRWAAKRASSDPAARTRLAQGLIGLARATLKHGRLKTFLKEPDDPRAADLGDLSGHIEGCGDLPPHRWFAIDRAVADGLVWIEVVVPEGELASLPGAPWSTADSDSLGRAVAGPVLATLAARSQRMVLAAAADGMRALLARPAIRGAVAGVALETRRLFVCVEDGESRGDCAEFSPAQADRLCVWLAERGVSAVGLTRLAGRGASAGLVRALRERGLVVEPIRSAGLMKQARGQAGPLKQAAAGVIARRLKDPLSGYADLEPDELGLGEYLDRLDPARLKAALEDARAAALWQRAQGRTEAGTARGLGLNPMIKGLADLRAGLEVSGVVVNLTHFGAFVDLGLEEQGLIHVSELSEEFVKHPAEVVQVGQQVLARIVEVDLDRRRIGLSLRPAKERKSRQAQSSTLKALDDLFKK